MPDHITAAAPEPGAVTQAGESPDELASTLPHVLIVGDSISLGYTDDVRASLAGTANVFRAAGNSGPSSSGVENAAQWIAEEPATWDVVHFNFGLHDIKQAPSAAEPGYPGGYQVPPRQYESNLRTIVSRFRSTGATLIFATTTPVPAGKLDPPRTPGDEVRYNAIARNVMAQNGVAIDDLYNVALPVIGRIQLHENVHFTPEGYGFLASAVAATIRRTLEIRSRTVGRRA